MEYGYITMKSGKGYLQKRTPAFRDSPYFCCPELPGFVENFRRKRKKFLDSCIGRSAGRIPAVTVEKI